MSKSKKGSSSSNSSSKVVVESYSSIVPTNKDYKRQLPSGMAGLFISSDGTDDEYDSVDDAASQRNLSPANKEKRSGEKTGGFNPKSPKSDVTGFTAATDATNSTLGTNATGAAITGQFYATKKTMIKEGDGRNSGIDFSSQVPLPVRTGASNNMPQVKSRKHSQGNVDDRLTFKQLNEKAKADKDKRERKRKNSDKGSRKKDGHGI
jgi:hypothetical protein